MTAGPMEPDDPDFVTFVDLAVTRVAQQVEDVDSRSLHLVLLLRRATDVVVYDLESAVHRPAGWSFAGFRLMFVLWLAGAMPPSRLDRLTGASRAATSALAKTLEADGLLARRGVAGDRRAVVLDLTDPGRQRLLAAFAEHHAREQARAHRQDDDEQDTLTRLLGKHVAGAGDPAVRSRS